MALTELHYPIGLKHILSYRSHRIILQNWCDRNCSGLVYCDILSDSMRWGFVFEEDAMAFKLTWL